MTLINSTNNLTPEQKARNAKAEAAFEKFGQKMDEDYLKEEF